MHAALHVLTRTLGCLGMALLLLAAPVRGQIPSEQFDRLAVLPVQYGGRVVTLAEAAQMVVMQCSHRSGLLDSKGEPLDPLSWWLNFITHTRSAQKVPIIRATSTWLIDSLNLDRRLKRRPSEVADLFSFLDLRMRMSTMDKLDKRLVQEIAAGHGNVKSQSELTRCIGAFCDLWEFFDAYPLVAKDHPLNTWGMLGTPPGVSLPPALVPPANQLGAYRDFGAMAGGPGRLEPAWIAVRDALQAWQLGDSAKLSEALDRWEQLLPEAEEASVPLDYSIPAGWFPRAGCPPEGAYVFGEIDAIGLRICSFWIAAEGGPAYAGIVYTDRARRSSDEIYADWIEVGSTLPEGTSELLSKPFLVEAGERSIKVQPSAGEASHAYGARFSLGAVIEDEGATLVLTLEGPFEAASTLREQFKTFLSTIRLQGGPRLHAWLGSPVTAVGEIGAADLVPLALALFSQEQVTWTLLLKGDPAQGDQAVETLNEVIESIGGLAWMDIEGMMEIPDFFTAFEASWLQIESPRPYYVSWRAGLGHLDALVRLRMHSPKETPTHADVVGVVLQTLGMPPMGNAAIDAASIWIGDGDSKFRVVRFPR